MSMKSLLAGVALATIAAGAQAATLSVIGGDAGVLPDATPPSSGFDIPGAGTPGVTPITFFTQATKNATNGLNLSGPGKVTFTFLGSEAGFENVVLVFGGVFVNNLTGTVGETSPAFNAVAGLLPFSFGTLDKFGTPSSDVIANDGGANANLRLAFGEVFNGGSSVIAYFDDAFPDTDFDDLAVQIDVAPIPLPAAGWLFGSALAGVGLLSRKRRAA